MQYGGHEVGPAPDQQPPGLQDGEVLMVDLRGSLGGAFTIFRLLAKQRILRETII
jgi:hypothetical protein